MCGPNLEEILTYSTVRQLQNKTSGTENRVVSARLRRGENGSYCLMGAKFSFSINSSGDDSKAVAQQKCALMPLNSVFKDRQYTFGKKKHLT